MRTLVVIALLLASCAPGPRVFGDGCSPRGMDEALLDACEQWPETCAVGERMDFYCVTQHQLDAISYCGLSNATRKEACTMWLGSSQAYRGRVYVVEGLGIADAIGHEAQHWHLWDDLKTNACATHAASCGWIED